MHSPETSEWPPDQLGWPLGSHPIYHSDVAGRSQQSTHLLRRCSTSTCSYSTWPTTDSPLGPSAADSTTGLLSAADSTTGLLSAADCDSTANLPSATDSAASPPTVLEMYSCIKWSTCSDCVAGDKHKWCENRHRITPGLQALLCTRIDFPHTTHEPEMALRYKILNWTRSVMP